MKKMEIAEIKELVGDLKKIENMLPDAVELIGKMELKLNDLNQLDDHKREMIKIRNKEYYQKHKEDRLKVMKDEYDAKFKSKRVICACGREVMSAKYGVHCKSNMHLKLMQIKEMENKNDT